MADNTLPKLIYGEQHFERLRETGAVYVDKTGYLTSILDPNGSNHFFSLVRVVLERRSPSAP